MQKDQTAKESLIAQRHLRDVLGRFPTGIAIVTSKDPQTNRPVGLAVSSFNSLSLDPPLILWSIGLKSTSLNAFRSHRYFAVNVLADDQEHLCKAFARSGADKFSGVNYDLGIADIPLLVGAAAHFQCETVERHPAGDHELYIGRVVDISTSKSEPLVFHGGSFRRLRPRENINFAATDG